ncbi:Ig-like domain repeat protein [Terriglobus sp. TAA 43]|uniref:NHL domain-containing protein n=1 Tax=Terriglobus sp. TAA 43 TaxID=278961 RepID=UPI000691CBC2|nr:Ig-like domain repeat protein [Terriglobus sp. TAA 43]
MSRFSTVRNARLLISCACAALLLGVTTPQIIGQTPAQLRALQQVGVRPLVVSGGQEASSQKLNNPAALAFDSAGNLYIADQNDQLVVEVLTTGIMKTVAGSGAQGYAGDGSAATSALLNLPAGVAVDAAGNVYIADTGNNVVRKVTPAGIISTIVSAGLAGPTALNVDSNSNLYIADTQNNVIRKFNGTTLTVVAGSGSQGFGGDGGAATLALLDQPMGVAVSSTTLYIADSNNNRIRAVNLSTGIITTFAGTGTPAFAGDSGSAASASFSYPTGLALDASGNLFVADTNNNRVREISSGGNVSTLAGNGQQGYSGDNNIATAATLNSPLAIASAPGGGVAVADTDNDRVRFVTPAGIIQTIAGTAAPGAESLQVAASSPSLVYGTAALTATFSNGGNTATGAVTFQDVTAGTTLGSVNLASNTASISLPALAAGIHQIVASYAGDGNNPAVASGIYVLTVTPVAVTASANAVAQPYGTAIPALTGTLTGVLPQDATTATAVYATTAMQTSAPGTYPITATLTGPTAANYTLSLASSSGSMTITKANTNITLSSNPTTQYAGVAVTLKAVVSSVTTGTPTGSVTFFDNGTAVGTVALTAGVAQISTSALAIGAHVISMTYSGDTNFLNGSVTASSGATTVTVASDPDFAVATTSGTYAARTIVPGDSATFNFTVTPVGGPFTSPITLAVSGLPTGATATLTPTSVTPGSSATNFVLTVSTQKFHAQMEQLAGGSVGLALLLLPFVRNRKMRYASNRMARLAMLLLLATAAGALSGCGSSGFFGQAQTASTITVTATGTNVAGVTVQHSTTVTLTVQ